MYPLLVAYNQPNPPGTVNPTMKYVDFAPAEHWSLSSSAHYSSHKATLHLNANVVSTTALYYTEHRRRKEDLMGQQGVRGQP